MDLGGLGWGLQTIIGAAVLAAVLIFALVRNRQARANRDLTEKETRKLYREEDAHRDPADDNVP